MNDSEASLLVEALNRMLAKEHACAIRYATHAALVAGPCVEPVAARFREIAGDEIRHADALRQRIRALGGMPTMRVDGGGLQPAPALDRMLDVNIAEEREAVRDYADILESVPWSDLLLRRTLEGILEDEQEHLEELLALIPPKTLDEPETPSQVRAPDRARAAPERSEARFLPDSRD